ncbi:hypothetical protein Pyn_23295 [Prunus yedoensis var. nudiflora]|uniref:Uncharacterized protein n=1 Tax=Prunus yedoensis var. nudiflora TaxID=2094558 RepID=A0A314V044_PRUYE|nr:hypothetical protein Pyn_23295 [Prunus yedoensis var. nudiflora]
MAEAVTQDMAKAVTLGTGAADLKPSRHSGHGQGRHSGHGCSRVEAKAITQAMAEAVTLGTGAAGLKPRSSLRPWPRPSLWARVQPGEAKAVTLAMGTAGVLSQMDMAKIESSCQTLPSSSIALQFLHGLKGRKVTPPGLERNLGHIMALAHIGFPRQETVGGQRGKKGHLDQAKLPRREVQQVGLGPGFGEATMGAIRAD